MAVLAGTLVSMAGPTNAAVGVIGRDAAGHLTLDGGVYRFVGINAYELGTWWKVNPGCGPQVDNLDQLFSALPGNSLVRFWAFQSQAINKYTHRVDWTALDRVFAAAARYHQRLIATLADQAGTCETNHWKDPSWYTGGYKQVFNSNGREPLSYAAWVDLVVRRYANHAALGMWEMMNEPEGTRCLSGYTGASCQGHTTCSESSAASALRAFFDTEAVHVKQLDPQHLVSFGAIGSGQCGTSGGNYQYVGASPGLDVLTVHDYGADSVGLPGDRWNGMKVRIAQAQALRKPIFTEEVGIRAMNGGTSCVTLTTRRDQLRYKLTAQLQAGMSGFTPWNWMPTSASKCSHDIGPFEPTTAMLSSASP